MTVKQIAQYLLLIAASLSISSCESVDDNRVPPVRVFINLGNTGLWNTYGVSGYGDYRFFSKKDRMPNDYSYTEKEYTGFGGVLLIYGVNGPLAYDRACPNEAKQDVVLNIDKENFEAVCPKCGSRFNVCEAYGAPLSGPALDNQYGMRRVGMTPANGGWIISN